SRTGCRQGREYRLEYGTTPSFHCEKGWSTGQSQPIRHFALRGGSTMWFSEEKNETTSNGNPFDLDWTDVSKTWPVYLMGFALAYNGFQRIKNWWTGSGSGGEIEDLWAAAVSAVVQFFITLSVIAGTLAVGYLFLKAYHFWRSGREVRYYRILPHKKTTASAEKIESFVKDLHKRHRVWYKRLFRGR